jgi:hypothetical protein
MQNEIERLKIAVNANTAISKLLNEMTIESAQDNAPAFCTDQFILGGLYDALQLIGAGMDAILFRLQVGQDTPEEKRAFQPIQLAGSNAA